MTAFRCALLLALAAACGAQDAIDQERKAYDEIYSAQPQTYSSLPNAFLTRTMTGRKPGAALDVGMGQGRNAIWLAENGWTVTGFDISPVGVENTRQEAAKRKLKIETYITPYERFDWGKEKWDLVVFSYFLPQAALPDVWESLKPGGLVLIEGFHADTAFVRPIGGGYTDKSMFEILRPYRVLIYEDVDTRQEWGRQFGDTNRLVRVLAQKPAAPPSGCSWNNQRYATDSFMCWGVSKWTCSLEGWRYSGRCEPQQQK